MLSKNKQKYIRSLEHKKYRRAEQAFVAEGPKVVGELLGIFPCRCLLATAEWLRANPMVQADEIIEVATDELARVGFMQTPQQVLGVFELPAEGIPHSIPKAALYLALDDVQDPGNVGTIVRIADWFGIEHIFCSPGTADVFAPKTLQATMGAIARVRLSYMPLSSVLTSLPEIPVYGTFLDGENIYEQPVPRHGIIVMGNEGRGISAELVPLITRKLLIPSYPPGRPTSESLNVAVATALVCAAFRYR